MWQTSDNHDVENTRNVFILSEGAARSPQAQPESLRTISLVQKLGQSLPYGTARVPQGTANADDRGHDGQRIRIERGGRTEDATDERGLNYFSFFLLFTIYLFD